MMCLSVCVSLVSVWCVCLSVFHWSVYGMFISLCFTAQCMMCLSVCVSLVSVWCVYQSVFHCSVYGVFVGIIDRFFI